jgi:hypothetical protein
VTRLKGAMGEEVIGVEETEVEAKVVKEVKTKTKTEVKPGTVHLTMLGDGEEIYSGDEADEAEEPASPTPKGKAVAFASAKEAAAEKVRAGEKRNVEHIAWIDETDELEVKVETKRKRGRVAK